MKGDVVIFSTKPFEYKEEPDIEDRPDIEGEKSHVINVCLPNDARHQIQILSSEQKIFKKIAHIYVNCLQDVKPRGFYSEEKSTQQHGIHSSIPENEESFNLTRRRRNISHSAYN